jgi:hypothetical protein
MTKSILVSLAILTLATSSVLAAQPTHRRHPMNASASVAPPPAPAPVMWMGGASSGDRDMYIKNLRESGYDTKRNYNSFGNLATQ